MKILVIADVEAKYYYDYYIPGKLDEFELILACGDLKKDIWNLLLPWHIVQSCMCVEIMMIVCLWIRREDVSVLKIRFMNIKEYVS